MENHPVNQQSTNEDIDVYQSSKLADFPKDIEVPVKRPNYEEPVVHKKCTDKPKLLKLLLTMLIVNIIGLIYYLFKWDILNDSKFLIGRLDDYILYAFLYMLIFMQYVKKLYNTSVYFPKRELLIGLIPICIFRVSLVCFIIECGILTAFSLGRFSIRELTKSIRSPDGLDKIKPRFYSTTYGREMSKLNLLWLICFILYISPIDLLPDAIPFVGTLDDLLITQLIIYTRASKSVKALSDTKLKMKEFITSKDGKITYCEHIITSTLGWVPGLGTLLSLVDFIVVYFNSTKTIKRRIKQ